MPTDSPFGDRRPRTHQRLALAALDVAWSQGQRRAWVELPPGAGKTLVGLATARALLATGAVRRVVALGPNTAIQGQWLAAARELGLPAGTDRTLDVAFTALTYQSLAVFDADLEIDEQGAAQPLLARLHENGAALVEALRSAGPLLLVLDECHHLLEVWGRLLAEVLDGLPEARVLGLTATPPEALTVDEAALVDQLFGRPVFSASLPAVVREGDLAPFAELAWLVEPTPTEARWLDEGATRFAELVTALTDPTFGSTGFLTWADTRLLDPSIGWAELAHDDPELASAALRLHHVGLLGLPNGARPTEADRTEPTADDWVLLIDDWLRGCLLGSGAPGDDAVVAAVRRALPAVGYQWTRRGIRRGRSPVDRVLARSEAKTGATVEIVGIEGRNLGERLRMLVLCDHERASATLPVDLTGVLDAQSGSARAVLAGLLADPTTADLSPLLVTGSTVAGAPATLTALRAYVASRDPELAAGLTVEPGPGDPGPAEARPIDPGSVHPGPGDPTRDDTGAVDRTAELVGGWSSRQWVRWVTEFFEQGGTRVLVGTRGLLGEGWDARSVTGLIDLTAVTTTTAVVQTRGRALRVDPAWPEKVALTWSVVCVAAGHPKGGNDWARLVGKHDGFYGVDAEGDVVDGVGHLDAEFSPFAPPPRADFDAINARMTLRSEDRPAIAAAWRVGAAYSDQAARTVRIRPRRRTGADAEGEPTRFELARMDAAVVAVDWTGRLRTSDGHRPPIGVPTAALAGTGVATGAGLAATASGIVAITAPVPGALAVATVAALGGSVAARGRTLVRHGRVLLAEAARPPGVGQVARAVADALTECELTAVGSAGVQFDVEPDGSYRCTLVGVSEAESTTFATALEEAIGPILRPRYVVPRWTPPRGEPGRWAALRAAFGRADAPGEVWHPVPAVLAVNAARAQAYGRAWQHWVGGGDPLFTGSPEGAGILAAEQGADPFDVTTVLRRQWR